MGGGRAGGRAGGYADRQVHACRQLGRWVGLSVGG